MEVVFKREDYKNFCSYDKCEKDAIVHYSLNNIEKHLCKKHFDGEVTAMNEQGIKNNSIEVNEYFAKIKEQKNRPKNTCLKQSSFNDHPTH